MDSLRLSPQSIDSAATPITIKAGEIIHRPGDCVAYVYRVVSGAIRCETPLQTGHVISVNLHEGDFFGDMELMLDTDSANGWTHTGLAEAIDHTVCLRIPAEDFARQVRQTSDFMRGWMENTVDKSIRSALHSQLDLHSACQDRIKALSGQFKQE